MLLSVLRSSRYSDVGEGLPGEGQMTLDILADDGLLVVAGDIVPLDTWEDRVTVLLGYQCDYSPSP